jgi:spermidine/putrescine transport system ATP-binding protein
VDGRGLEDDEPHAASRAGLVVGEEVVRRQALVDERRLMGGRDDPVRELDWSYAQRAEERFEQIASLLTGRALTAPWNFAALALRRLAPKNRALERQSHTDPAPAEPGDGHIVLAEVTKLFGDLKVVDVDLSIAKGEFFSLLGPSGCGKTTTLRMIAGFEEPTTGRVLLAGRDVTEVPSAKRPVNMVFQAYALFPHMTVFENVAFGLRIRRVGRREIEDRVAEVMRIVQLEGMSKRKPIQLSGGQQQRVALARALVNRPEALLLDEPLGALDLKLRKEMQLELKHIQVETQTTFVYVTHDQEEALTMSDRIAVMDQGFVEQVAEPRELYERPATPFVAGFIGVSNVVHLRPDRTQEGMAVMTVGEGERVVAPSGSAGSMDEILITVRPEKIKFDDVGEPASRVSATVADVVYLGSMTQYIVELPTGEQLTVHRLNDEVRKRPIQIGDRVTLYWAAEHSFVIERPEPTDNGTQAEGVGEIEAVGETAASRREA